MTPAIRHIGFSAVAGSLLTFILRATPLDAVLLFPLTLAPVYVGFTLFAGLLFGVLFGRSVALAIVGFFGAFGVTAILVILINGG